MSDVIVNVLNGLTYGALLAIVASGLALIFGFLHIVNFAHGALFMVGAYIAMSVHEATGWFLLAVLVGTIGVVALGFVIHVLILARMPEASSTDYILVTFGVMLVLDNAVRMIWGTSTHRFPPPDWLDGSISVAGANYPSYRLLLIAVAVIVCAVGSWILVGTGTGRQIRAVIEDREMGLALGINGAKLMLIVFGVGVGLAGMAGGFAAPYLSVEPTMGANLLIDAFLVVSLAGLGNFLASFASAFAIGGVYTIGNVVAPSYSLALVLGVVIVALLWRPQGVFVRAAVAK